MTATLPSLTPAEAHDQIASGQAVLIDIREADEFARSHIAAARSVPLSCWDGAALPLTAITRSPGSTKLRSCSAMAAA